MAWLLDTSVLSELRKGDRCDERVQTWLDGVADEDLFTSVLVIGEIRRGIEILRRRDPTAAAMLDHWLGRLSDTYAERILPIDRRVAECWAALNVPNPVPTVDGLLAATAMEHDLTVVTRNTRDVAALGVPILDPFVG